MPDYAYFFSYRPETWAQLLAGPGDRTPAVRATVEDAGGELRSLYYTLDAFGGLAIVGAPDADTAATIGLVITASGAFTDVRVQPLVNAADVVPVLERARDTAAGYRRPGH
ncbi:GYD domain-containing protein [Actinomycetospora chlora]|uniref:GYD domain-containing protein n=1 Tax=Actinomycetospora chlora TaxID=663608 RepID=A0ABP9BI60_9PSEU